MNYIQIGSGALLIAVLAACSTPAEQRESLRTKTISEGWERVPTNEVQTLFSDATLSGATDKTQWSTYQSPDQTTRGIAKGSWGEETDSGTYKITADGTWCRTWTKWGNGQEGCAEVYRKEGRLKMVVVSGKIGELPSFEADIEPGNPLAL